MRNLLWKEWHEQAWKLAFGCVVLSAMAAIGLHTRLVSDATIVTWVCFLGVMVLPVLSSTGLLPAERDEGSLEALVALPVRPWQIVGAKTVMGLLLCVGPLALAAVVSVALAGGREAFTGAMLGMYGRSALASAGMFMWMVALTVRLPTEARAALLAVGVAILWVMVTGGLAISTWRVPLLAASPLAFVDPTVPQFGPGPRFAVVLVVQLAVSAGAWLMAVRLFAAGEAR